MALPHTSAPSLRPALLVVCLLLAATQAAYAQVDVERLRRDAPPLGRSGTLGGDMTIRTGNVDFIQIGLDARLYDVTESATTLMVLNGGLGFLRRDRFASSGLAHYRRTYHYERPVSPEWYGQLNYDRAQLLSFRALAGGGIRAAFAQGDWGTFGAGSALMLEHERLDLPEDALHPDQTLTVRWSNFLTLRVVPEANLVVTSTTYFQPEVQDFTDVRALQNLRIATEVTEALALTVSFDLRYDSDPPDGISSLDTSLRTGVTYTY